MNTQPKKQQYNTLVINIQTKNEGKTWYILSGIENTFTYFRFIQRPIKN